MNNCSVDEEEKIFIHVFIVYLEEAIYNYLRQLRLQFCSKLFNAWNFCKARKEYNLQK